MQPAVAGYRDRRPADEVAQPVEVVTALGQQAGAGRVRPAPVAAHVRVGVMPPADRLQVLHADDLAQPAGGHDPHHRLGVGRVPHHVADRQDDPGLLHGPDRLDALGPGGRDRLLQQHVVAKLGEAGRRDGVLAVRRGHEDRVGQPRPPGQLPPVAEPLAGRHGELVRQRVTAVGAGIGDRHHPGPVREPLGEPGVDTAPGTRAEHGDRYRSRHYRQPPTVAQITCGPQADLAAVWRMPPRIPGARLLHSMRWNSMR